MKPTWRHSSLLFHSHKTPKKLTTEWPVVEQRQDHHEVRHVWSMGVLLFVLREIQMSTQVIWKYFTKNVKIRLIFQTFSLISPKWYVFCLQLYAWLESCDQDGSFGTQISGSLIFSPVLWVLSSRNTLSVTHSDTASYHCVLCVKLSRNVLNCLHMYTTVYSWVQVCTSAFAKNCAWLLKKM